MASDTRTAIINAMLTKLKEAMDDGRFTFWHDRPDKKNSDTLYLLQFDLHDAISQMKMLERIHYRKGPYPPSENPDDPELWEFKKRMNEYEIYIKFKWSKKHNWFTCVSFHVNEEGEE